MKMKGDAHNCKALLRLIYHSDLVESRYQEIPGNIAGEAVDDTMNVGYGKAFFDPVYTRASILGCTIAIFQQLTGINILMFYSNTIFEDAGITWESTKVTALMGGVNFVSSIFGVLLLFKFGRKTLMFFWNFWIVGSLTCLGIFQF